MNYFLLQSKCLKYGSNKTAKRQDRDTDFRARSACIGHGYVFTDHDILNIALVAIQIFTCIRVWYRMLWFTPGRKKKIRWKIILIIYSLFSPLKKIKHTKHTILKTALTISNIQLWTALQFSSERNYICLTQQYLVANVTFWSSVETSMQRGHTLPSTSNIRAPCWAINLLITQI